MLVEVNPSKMTCSYHKLTFRLLAWACVTLAGANLQAQQETLSDLGDQQYYSDEYPADDAPWDETQACDSDNLNSPACGDGLVYGDGYSQVWGGYGHWRAWCERLRFRHSSTDGRWTGKGQPLRSTSWLNRPYSFGLETGGLLMASRISSNNTRNNDVLAAANIGWDWDHYWGTQFRVAWSTPELSSSVASTSSASNDVFLYDLTLLYYPWGDSRVRPYYRFGLGLTDLDFINPAGQREDATLLSMPIGVGIKYQTQRWMALRAEAVDYITWGQNSASNMQNFTLTFGVEWRFGGRPSTTWSSPTQRGAW